ncbi:MAG: patatin family protein [Mariprofundus sp.]|nr:patatin family protein [Mariprofundus sp.]
MTCALIIEGGAMRSVFSAGLLDGFLQRDFNPFDCYIGVSAGASNLAMFLAGEQSRSLQFFIQLAGRKDFISPIRFLRGGHLLDLDMLMAAIMAEKIDLAAIFRNKKPFLVCTTDVENGKPNYFETNASMLLDALKASMALPLIYRKFPVLNGRASVDGGMSDAVPVAEMIRRGATRLMVVRSRPAAFIRKDSWGHRYIRWQLRDYPLLVHAMQQRVERHRQVNRIIARPPPGIEIVDICPPAHFRMGRFASDQQQVLLGYHAGLSMADDAISQWSRAAT